MDEIISLSNRGNNSAMSIIFSGPFLSMFLLLLSGKDMKVIPNPILFRGL